MFHYVDTAYSDSCPQAFHNAALHNLLDNCNGMEIWLKSEQLAVFHENARVDLSMGPISIVVKNLNVEPMFVNANALYTMLDKLIVFE